MQSLFSRTSDRIPISRRLHSLDVVTLGLVEEGLRYLKESPESFGGCLVLLMGDHYQLSPVNGTPLYRSVDCKGRQLEGTAMNGHKTYLSIKKVVYLEENMRFRDDPQWGRYLAEARTGVWTTEMRQLLLSRHVDNISPEEWTATFVGKHTPIITPSNELRAKYNLAALHAIKKNSSPELSIYKVPAVLSCTRRLLDLPSVMLLPDNKTEGLPTYLYLYDGMPVRTKANQIISKGVANNAPSSVAGIQWEQDTVFSCAADGFLVPSKEPLNIYVDVENAPPTPAIPGLPSSWPRSICPVAREKRYFSLNGVSVSIDQFPIVPGFSATTHGVQGMTCETICVDNPRPQCYRNVDRNSLYVALSRVKTSAGLALTTLLTTDDFTYFCPTLHLHREDARLTTLAQITLDTFS